MLSCPALLDSSKDGGRRVFVNNQVCENSGYRDFLERWNFLWINDSAEGAIREFALQGYLLRLNDKNKTATARKKGLQVNSRQNKYRRNQ